MKFGKILLFGVLCASLSSIAYADTISFSGTASLTTTGITFGARNSSGTYVNDAPGTVKTTGTGVFSTFTATTAIGYTSPGLGAGGSGVPAFHFYSGTNTPSTLSPLQVLTVTQSGVTLNVFITSVSTGAVAEGASTKGTFTAHGYFTQTGSATQYTYDSLIFTNNATGTAGTQQPFTAVLTYTVAATPEPGGLLLLGTGMVGAAGALLRRRRI